MSQTVVGLFENAADAQEAVRSLQQIGISTSNIDVARGGSDSGELRTSNTENEGGIARFFKNLFGDNDESERYTRVGSTASTIVTVHAQSGEEARRAADVLDNAGAMDVEDRAARYATTGTGRSDSDATISRVQEELQVGKREVESGGVRVRSRIVERPVEESIRLREEHVNIERTAVNRPLSDADAAFEERSIELTERAEVPVVNKEARVVEEIRINKDVDERTETIRDTVRNTEVDIDKIDEDSTRSNTRNL